MASKICLGVCLLALALTISDSKCPIDWAGYGTNCYWFSNNVLTYTQAAGQCRKMGAHLVSDDSEAKHQFLAQFLSVFYSMSYKTFWTGASDFAVEGSWRWIETGAPIGPYTAWGPGEPNGNDTQNCMVFTWSNTSLTWADAVCEPHAHGHHHTAGNHFICEKSLSSFTAP